MALTRGSTFGCGQFQETLGEGLQCDQKQPAACGSFAVIRGSVPPLAPAATARDAPRLPPASRPLGRLPANPPSSPKRLPPPPTACRRARRPKRSAVMSKPPPRIVTLARTTSWKNEEVGSPKKRQRGGVKWDEDNLRVNEEIKAELDCQKIDEPDTPFVRSPQREEDDSDDEPPGAAQAAALRSRRSTGGSSSLGLEAFPLPRTAQFHVSLPARSHTPLFHLFHTAAAT